MRTGLFWVARIVGPEIVGIRRAKVLNAVTDKVGNTVRLFEGNGTRKSRRHKLHITTQSGGLGQPAMHLLRILEDGDFIVVGARKRVDTRCYLVRSVRNAQRDTLTETVRGRTPQKRQGVDELLERVGVGVIRASHAGDKPGTRVGQVNSPGKGNHRHYQYNKGQKFALTHLLPFLSCLFGAMFRLVVENNAYRSVRGPDPTP